MRTIAIAVVALMLTGAVAFAQPAGQAQVPPPMPLGEIQKLLDGYAMVQAQEYLGMTDAQFGPFLPKLQALQAARRRGDQERMRLLMELRRLTNARSQAPDSEIQNRVRALRDLEVRSVSDIQGAYDAIDQTAERSSAGAVSVVRAGNRTAKSTAPDAHASAAEPREPPPRESPFAVGSRLRLGKEFP